MKTAEGGKIQFRIWTGSDKIPTDLGLVDGARRFRLPDSLGYRVDDGSLAVFFNYTREQTKPFEDWLVSEGYQLVAREFGGKRSNRHFAVVVMR